MAIKVAMWVPAILIIAGSGACSREQWGFPRTAVASTSPDGRYRAVVKNHAAIDPPAQSLWLTSTGGPAREIRRLSEDQDWCNVIAWSGDSRSVAFLVQDARLIVVDAATRQERLDHWLVDRDGYPTAQMVTDLAWSGDGSSVRFAVCLRGTAKCTERLLALPRR